MRLPFSHFNRRVKHHQQADFFNSSQLVCSSDAADDLSSLFEPLGARFTHSESDDKHRKDLIRLRNISFNLRTAYRSLIYSDAHLHRVQFYSLLTNLRQLITLSTSKPLPPCLERTVDSLCTIVSTTVQNAQASSIAGPVNPGHVYTVFISHAGEDKLGVALPLAEQLELRNIRAFVDRRDLQIGGEAGENMIRAMETAKIGVVILSPEFIAKPWPMKELHCFLRRKRELEETGGEERGLGITLVPVFYRLGVDDCKNERIFESENENGEKVFDKWRFHERERDGSTSRQNVMNALKNAKVYTGIENLEGVTNEQNEEMNVRREQFVSDIANMISQMI